MSDPIRVLFICTGNSARSQMAEALLGFMGGSDFEVFSGGTEPKGVNPYTVCVLDEVCIDWSAARSKPGCWRGACVRRSTVRGSSLTTSSS